MPTFSKALAGDPGWSVTGAVWPGTFVEDQAMTRPVWHLRQAPGWQKDDGLETTPKPGYRLTVPVCVQLYPGSEPRTRVSFDGGNCPAWSKDGRALFFLELAGANRKRRMMAADFRPAAAAPSGSPRPLFEFDGADLLFDWAYRGCHDISRDGQRFLVTRVAPAPQQTPVTHINLIEDWFEELKTKVPRRLAAGESLRSAGRFDFQLARAISQGLIPSLYFSDDTRAELDAYAGVHLQQEVVAEGATRNAQAFNCFLRVAALADATIVDSTNLASDAQVSRTTIYEYFEILKDRLVVHELTPWRRRGVRKPIVSAEYYFFDVGVEGAL